jgi:hypothetical protein
MIVAVEAAETLSGVVVEVVVTDELSIAAVVVSAMTLVVAAVPTDDPPVAIDTCPAPALICEVSVPETLTLAAETVETAEIPASAVLAIVLLTVEPD